MEESKLREIAKEYLTREFEKSRFHMPFEIFHGKGPLTMHLRRKFHGDDLTTIPNFDVANVEPDIAGIIISSINDQKLWIIAEVKANEQSVSQGDRRQAVDYANATNAFKAFLISDGQLGQDVKKDLKVGLHKYNGMFETGQKGNGYLVFIRYLERTGQFAPNR
jgi:hypothetical protein